MLEDSILRKGEVWLCMNKWLEYI